VSDALAHLSEDLIAGDVPEKVIETREAIDIDAQKPDRPEITFRERDRSCDLSEREPPVRREGHLDCEPGELVKRTDVAAAVKAIRA